MSFALDFRKKLQEKEREAQRVRKENAGFVTMPLGIETDTRGNRRRVIVALFVAGGLLAVLNSGGLVNYAYTMTDTRAGQLLVVASEKWHGMMEHARATQPLDHIRGSVAAIRETSWRDLRVVFGVAPEMPGRATPEHAPVLPAAVPEPVEPPRPQETVRPDKREAPKGPVMRASADAAAVPPAR